VNNAVDGAEAEAEASVDDKPAAESKVSRRPHPVSRFEVLLIMHRNVLLTAIFE